MQNYELPKSNQIVWLETGIETFWCKTIFSSLDNNIHNDVIYYLLELYSIAASSF